jgi:pantoate--beta-alanine ligase
MLKCNTIEEMRNALAQCRRTGKSIGFVPTMGNLHEGHLQVVQLAQQHCDVVVVSIFVNELQFGINEDFDAYPRTLDQDIEKLESVNTNFLFYPKAKEIYPNGLDLQTITAVPKAMTDILCGASRKGHFTGVTTIVSKLCNIVEPDKLFLGLKDFQQLKVIQRMVEDLCMPIEVIEAPIARADDGLALSSRNRYLSANERSIAPRLHQYLLETRQSIIDGERDYRSLEEKASHNLLQIDMQPDYYAIYNRDTLQPAAPHDKALIILVAAYLGKTRLIDNVTLDIS